MATEAYKKAGVDVEAGYESVKLIKNDVKRTAIEGVLGGIGGFGGLFEIPEGYAGFIFPRSSNHKSGLLLTNSVGILDSCYRGEVTAKFASRTKLSRPAKFWEKLKLLFGSNPEGRNMAVTTNEVWNKDINYNIGDRVAQMVILPYPKVEFVEVDELSDTERGTGGYGSTGK